VLGGRLIFIEADEKQMKKSVKMLAKSAGSGRRDTV